MKSRAAFTMIELIVVMAILALAMAITLPKGSKLLESFEKKMANASDNQKLSNERAKAFLNVLDQDVTIGEITYNISSMGVITKK